MAISLPRVVSAACDRVTDNSPQTGVTKNVQATAVRDNGAKTPATVNSTLPDPKTWRATHLTDSTRAKLTAKEAGAYFELAVKMDRAIGQYKEALIEMAKSKDFLTRQKAIDALSKFESTDHKWNADAASVCPKVAAACTKSYGQYHSVTYQGTHPDMASVQSGDYHAYSDAAIYGLLDIVAHEMGHTSDLNRSLSRYLYVVEKTYGLDIEGPYESVKETNANDWMKEVRPYYKIPPVKVLEGVVVTGSKAGN